MLASIVVCSSAVACLLVAEWVDSRIARIATKMSAASAFVAMALAAGALESDFGRIMLVGFALCWIGDACLLSDGHSAGFRAGIGAFLLGHLAYALAFQRLGIDLGGFVAGCVAVAVFAGIVLRWLRPHLPESFRIPVLAYLAVISLMVATSIGAVAGGGPIWLAVGAVGFATSDLFVARDRFVRAGFMNAGVGLPLYFASQMLLAFAVSLAPRAVAAT